MRNKFERVHKQVFLKEWNVGWFADYLVVVYEVYGDETIHGIIYG